MDVQHLTAQGSRFFDESDFESLIRQGQGRGHAAQSSPDDQTVLVDGQGFSDKGLQESRPGDGHPHQFDRLFRGHVRLGGVDPGTLVPDVGQFEQVGIQSRLAQGFAEKGLVGPRGAGGDHHPVQPVLLDPLLDFGKTRVRTGVHGVRGDDHVGIAGNGRGHLFHIHRAARC